MILLVRSLLLDTSKVSPIQRAFDDVPEKATLGVDSMEVQHSANIVAASVSASPGRTLADDAGVKSKGDNAPNGIRSSPPVIKHADPMDIDTIEPNGLQDDVEAGTKSDSEAETIVLPGKDGHSPAKIRKSIKHEDKSDDDHDTKGSGLRSPATHVKIPQVLIPQPRPQPRPPLGETLDNATGATSTTSLGKRKRPKASNNTDDPAHLGNSSGLSSVPTSPVATTHSSLSKPTASDSDVSKASSSRSHSAPRERGKSGDRGFQRRNYPSHSGDDDDSERQRFLSQRSSGAEHKSSRDGRLSSKYSSDLQSRKRTRSISPPTRGHRRSVSTQITSKSSHGLSHKKKRVPAPLQSTEYHSDESSGGSSPPLTSRLRNLTAPITGGSTMSPVKMVPHKKHVNSSGQTLLARACLSGKLDIAKQRYEERPQDLNEPDHALNTPLHVASINGYTDVVKFLLGNGCTVDVVNDQKDTPLHDAIENGHVEVVRLLFNAGANPNKPNRHGDEPLDLVNEKEESGDYGESDADTIRESILAAKKNNRDTRRQSEDDNSHFGADPRNSHRKGARHSPSVQLYESSFLSSTSRRAGTARSQKTSGHVLWQPLDATELQKAARDGDVSAAARVLEVHTNLNDTKSLTLAAKGGHLDVLNILFAMGGFDPDPPLADGVSLEQATPLLAAIGRDAHLKVIELILGQDNFDPTRRIKGQTYFEIAKKRAGPNWQEEEKLLKDAFEQYEKSHKSSPRKPRSPGRRRDGREANREASRKVGRVEDQQARSHKRSMSSPKAKENDTQKGLIRSSTGLGKDGQVKRGPGRPRKENLPSATASDPENVPSGPSKQKSHVKRSGSELGIASENEMAAKPRRKLVCAKELRDERKLEKQRRTSVASTASGISIKDKRVLSESKPEKNEKPEGRLSPNIPRLGKKASSANNDPDTPDRQSLDKDRARSIKRDDSKDRITAIRGESPVKSHRNSATPPRSSMQEVTIGYGVGGGPLKRRKLDGDESRSESTANSSPELRNIPLKSPLPNHEESVEKAGSSIRVKTHSVKKQNGPTDDQPKTSSESKSPKTSKQQIQRQSRLYEPEAKKSRKASEEHAERIEKEKEKAIKRKEEEAAREAEAAKVKKAEEQAELERVERANKARLAREEAAREEEAKRQKEEAEKKERQRILEVDAHNRAMEEQRVLYLEQEKIKREEQEKRRTLALEQQRAERARLEEQKRLERLSRLPLLLRWFDIFEDTKNSEFANLFRWIDGYRYDTIRPEATGWANAREQWMLNTSVSILLGEKDLHLSRYTAWERIPLSYDAKRAVWRAQNGIFTLREPSLAGFRKQFPSEGATADEVVKKNKSLFLDLDLFFVKVSEFMFVVPSFPHLRDVKMVVNYRELVTSFQMPPPPPKWKQDPDTDPNQRFTPQPKIFIRGQLVKHQDEPMTKVLTEPPTSDNRVPRRELVPVYPTDPDYEEICKRQGLRHLLLNYQNSSSTPPPLIPRQNGHVVNELTNGITPPSSVRTKSINGGSPTRGSLSEPDAPQNQSVSPTEVIPPALG